MPEKYIVNDLKEKRNALELIVLIREMPYESLTKIKL